MEIKNDGMRTEIINKLDEVINKAIEDKNLTVLGVPLPDLSSK